MKYGIITHYDVHNHGAILQLNALATVLREQFCIEAQALQFEKNYDFMGVDMKAKYDISIKSVGIYLNFLHERGLKCTKFNFDKRKLLNAFKQEHHLIGDYYTECGDLDGVVVGSDEVFALHTGPTPVFFGHACPSKKVFAYAGCFGPTRMEDIRRLHCEAFVKSGLDAMQGISVRDANSQKIVEKLLGKNPKRVCDPVILYGYEKEIAKQSAPSYPPYLLVYAYDNRMNDAKEVAFIKQYAEEHGLKTLSPGFYHSWCDYNVNVDPVELLGYFAHSNGVVTDTFHGSVMSIITGAELAVKTRDNANKLENLLEEYHLTHRMVSSFDKLSSVFSKKVDYVVVNEEVERRRKESLDFLESMIKL